MGKITKGRQRASGQRGMRVKRQKRIWTDEEDVSLLELIDRFGPARWSIIAGYMEGRQGKQCRERWHNHLNPAINKSSWREEEEWLLFLLYKLYGSRWAVLAQMIPGRTDNTIKNHWNSIMRRKTKALEARLEQSIEALPHHPSENHLEEFLLRRIANKEFEGQTNKKGRKRSYSRFFEKSHLEQFMARGLVPVTELPTTARKEDSAARTVRTPGRSLSQTAFFYHAQEKTANRSPGPLFSAERSYSALFGTEEKLSLATLLRCTPQKSYPEHPLEGSFAKYFRRTEDGGTTPRRPLPVEISAFDLPVKTLSITVEWD